MPVRARVQFNLLMALRGLQPEVLMIIFREVVVMVWPQHQWPFCCLHTDAGSVWGCVYFAAEVMMDRELRGWWQSWSCWHINVYLHRG